VPENFDMNLSSPSQAAMASILEALSAARMPATDSCI
jgi:hypothetical protein